MHIIVMTSTGAPSGGVRQAVYLAAGLRKSGHSVDFVCPFGGGTQDLARSEGLECVELPRGLRQAERALSGLMPAGEPVVLHAFHNRGVKLAAYLGTYWRVRRRPVICVAHRGVTSRPGNPLPYLLPGIKAYLVNSRACAATLPLLWRKKRCHVVHNCIPDERLQTGRTPEQVLAEVDIPVSSVVLGNVTNDNPKKGAGNLIRAYAKVRSVIPSSHLLLVGAHPDSWLGLCEELGVADRVRFIPYTEQVADYLQVMSLLAFTSTFIESQPNVILEAMSMGVPVIAGKVGGVPELLPEKFLFDPASVDEISQKILGVMESPELLQEALTLSRRKRKHFSLANRVKLCLRHYQAALKEYGYGLA